MDGKGIHRTRGAGDGPDTARVVDRSVSFDLPEPQYRARGYAPPFDELAWKVQTPDAVSDPEAPFSRPRR
jgi:hypothetical protein